MPVSNRPAALDLVRRCAVALAVVAAVAALAQPAAAAAAVKATRPGPPIVLAAPRSLDAAVAAILKATRAKSEPLVLGGKPVPATEGRSFSIDAKIATRLLDGSHATYLKAGLYLFRYERSFGMAGAHDHVAVLATTDGDSILRRMGTHDEATKRTPDQIVEWLAALAKEEPFYLNEIGEDYVAGTFKTAPRDPAAVARRCAEFAPELVKGSGNALDLLAEEIRTHRALYLIW
jgi:hypothetical protein